MTTATDLSGLDCFERLISPKYGVFSEISFRPTLPGGPRVFWATVLSRARPGAPVDGVGSAAAFRREPAVLRALGEAVERYSARDHGQKKIIKHKTARELRAQGLPTIALERFNYSPADPTLAELTPLDWMDGYDLTDQSSVQVPAMVTFFSDSRWPGSHSSGLSCGRTREQSLIAALLEIVERDAFAATWWRQQPWPEIRWKDSQDPQLQNLAAAIGPWAKNLRFFSPVMDHGLRPIFCVFDPPSHNEKVRFLISGACHLNPRVALEKALLEMAQCYLFTKANASAPRQELFPADFNATIRKFNDGVQLYASGQGADAIRFLLEPNDLVNIEELPSHDYGNDPLNLKSLVSELSGIGTRPVAVDLTTRDIQLCGLVVHRVLVPELVPINAGHRHRPTGHSRLSEIWKPQKLNPLNSMPHPFP